MIQNAVQTVKIETVYSLDQIYCYCLVLSWIKSKLLSGTNLITSEEFWQSLYAFGLNLINQHLPEP